MSQWADRIRNHPVWEQLSALGPAIDQAVAREGGIDPQSADSLERLRTVLTFTGKRLAATDPFTTTPGALDAIVTALRSAVTEIQTFASDGNTNHLNTANTHADSALINLAQVCTPFTSEDLGVLNQALLSYRSTFEKQLTEAANVNAQFVSERDALRTKLTELGNEIAAERQRLSQLTSDHQGQFSAAQEVRNREYTEAQTARQDKFASTLSDYVQRLTEQNADFTRQKENAFKQYQDDVDSLKKNYAESGKALLDEIEQHKQKVEKLVGVIGNLGVTSGYLRTANYARRSLWFWQGLTVLSMAPVIIVAYVAFIPVIKGTFTWESFAARVFLCVTMGVLAAYSAFQADKFFEIERRNRKMALELEAIGPYLAPLPQEMQDKFRIDIGDRSFGREEAGLGKKADKSPASVIDVLMKSKDSREFLRDLIKDLLKSLKISS